MATNPGPCPTCGGTNTYTETISASGGGLPAGESIELPGMNRCHDCDRSMVAVPSFGASTMKYVEPDPAVQWVGWWLGRYRPESNSWA